MVKLLTLICSKCTRRCITRHRKRIRFFVKRTVISSRNQRILLAVYNRELASNSFNRLTLVECERNTCELFYTDLRIKGLRSTFILKLAENLSVALIKARGCEALEQLDEKRLPRSQLCLAFSQHSLNSKQIPPPNRPAVPTGDECWYCQRFGRRVRHCDHNPLALVGFWKDGSPGASYEALSSVISPDIAVYMKPLSVRGSINKETVLFSVCTGAS
ncbi:hypothetical protein AHF37_10838 [Paragonimus kellicotti]|nr:hypothetical protein AHF37_10838 [Paragonimus kellicotti]